MELLLYNREHIPLAENDHVFAVKLHFGSGIFAEDDPVADFYLERQFLAVFENFSGAYGENFALGGLFLRGVGQNDAAAGFFFVIDNLDYDSISKRFQIHCIESLLKICSTEC